MTTIFLTHPPDVLKNYYSDKAVSALGELGTVHLNVTGVPLATDALIAEAAGCDIIVADRATPGEARLFGSLPGLVAFVRGAVDIRNIDVDAASANGVLVTRGGPGFVNAVAELIVGMMVDLGRGVSRAVCAYRAGRTPDPAMGVQLAGSSLGIIGYGSIGSHLARLGLALGMRIMVADPYKRVDEPGVEQADLPTLMRESDFVVCLAIASAETENLIDEAALAHMKPTAYFINASRGELVDEAALERA
ncbi:MAG: NAD(P)-dependent oxidoreductase, partial [Alphaproteobacteria bacterium]